MDKLYKDMNHKEKADYNFDMAAWNFLYGTSGYVEIFLRAANYHFSKLS